MPIERAAHAKVNLALSVGPALAGGPQDGMHPIASWMHAIDLCDTVRIERLATGPSAYEVAWAAGAPRVSAIDWPLDKDLAARAHRLMQEHTGRTLPVHLSIEKRVPVGGGLGGGSSDAAAVMLGLNEAFGLGVPIARLAEWSGRLGSDVAFFLDQEAPPRPAIVTGLGDRVERLARAAAWVVLVVPGFGCPTGAVYRAFDRAAGPGLREGSVRALAAASIDAGGLFNDLTGAAIRVEPRLGALMEGVARAAGLPAHMSGSGSTVFVPAPDGGRCRAISEKIRAGVPDVTVLGVRLV